MVRRRVWTRLAFVLTLCTGLEAFSTVGGVGAVLVSGASREQSPPKAQLPLPVPQQPGLDLHRRWVSSTTLLCYGQMALHAKEKILPWVDNVASRMVYYFSSSPYVSPPHSRDRKAEKGSGGRGPHTQGAA